MSDEQINGEQLSDDQLDAVSGGVMAPVDSFVEPTTAPKTTTTTTTTTSTATGPSAAGPTTLYSQQVASMKTTSYTTTNHTIDRTAATQNLGSL